MNAKALKLGRLAPPPAKRRMRLSPDAVAHILPPAPPSWSAPAGIPYQLFANDKYGDCTCANAANLLIQLAACQGRTLTLSEQDVLDYYFKLGNGADDGLIETDVLAAMEADGFPNSGSERLATVVAVDPMQTEVVKSLCAIFHGLYVGALLPVRAQDQLQSGSPWSEPYNPWSTPSGDAARGGWGGHAMLVTGYTTSGPIFGTWGKTQQASWDWWRNYVDECYVILDLPRAQGAGPELADLVVALASAAQTVA